MKWIHVEASTFCNARCPLCPRNLYGYKVEGVYPEIHLEVDQLRDCLEKFPEREYVYFNGNLGDPMMNPDIVALTELAQCRTAITTNGSIGSKKTWEALAGNAVEVQFSIDGLEDTNHLYRQDVQWSKIMERVKWFINAGGTAIWKWIPFKHNIHQREDTEKLSKTLGFKSFNVEDHGRSFGPVINKEGTEITHWILPADDSAKPHPYDIPAGISRYKETHQNFHVENKVYDVKCEHLINEEIYISAKGSISPCCYQGYGTPGRPAISLDNFSILKDTWKTKRCDPVCAMSCGSVLKN